MTTHFLNEILLSCPCLVQRKITSVNTSEQKVQSNKFNTSENTTLQKNKTINQKVTYLKQKRSDQEEKKNPNSIQVLEVTFYEKKTTFSDFLIIKVGCQVNEFVTLLTILSFLN